MLVDDLHSKLKEKATKKSVVNPYLPPVSIANLVLPKRV